MKKTLILIAIWIPLWAAPLSFAATVPAGTTLSIRTVDNITSHDRVGKTFATKLDQDVAVNGNAVLRAGTRVFGRIEASRFDSRRSNPLSFDLISVSVHGKKVPIKTDLFRPEANPKTARQLMKGFSAGVSTIPPGTKLEFRLAQPVNL